MYLTGEQKSLALQMAQNNGAHTSCPDCARRMNPSEAEGLMGYKGRVFMRCENEHESHFDISYEQAEHLGVLLIGHNPETRG